MRDVTYLLRFFLIVPPVPPMMAGTFGALVLVSAVALADDPNRASGALAPVLVLQAFAASSGYVVPARRGHYDLLLSRVSRRSTIALTHWLASVTPGVASWLALAVTELLASAGRSHRLFAAGTLAAVGLVSTLPWAITVALPRFSGGIGWMLVVTTSATTFANVAIDPWTVTSTRLEDLMWPAWSFLLYPIVAVGRPLDRLHLLAVLPALAVAAGAMAAACRWIARADVPLEAAQ